MQSASEFGHRHQVIVADSHRSKSPRPKTLPGLPKSTSIPGLAQLAGNVLLNSPQAPQQVKAFAKTLVEGLITDSVTNGKRDDNAECQVVHNLENPLQVSAAEDGIDIVGCDDMTDISLSLATETDGNDMECGENIRTKHINEQDMAEKNLHES